MKKNLIINGEIIPMTLEETLMQFDKAIKQFADNCDRLLSGYNKAESFEDFCQLGSIKLMQVYDSYDINRKCCFSTLLINALKRYVIDIIRIYESDKRKSNTGAFTSTDAIWDDGKDEEDPTTPDFYVWASEEDTYFDTDTKLEEFLIKNLTLEERLLISSDLHKRLEKLDKKRRGDILFLIQALTQRSEKPPTKKAIAEMMNCSKPTVRLRTKKALIKLTKITETYIELSDL